VYNCDDQSYLHIFLRSSNIIMVFHKLYSLGQKNIEVLKHFMAFLRTLVIAFAVHSWDSFSLQLIIIIIHVEFLYKLVCPSFNFHLFSLVLLVSNQFLSVCL